MKLIYLILLMMTLVACKEGGGASSSADTKKPGAVDPVTGQPISGGSTQPLTDHHLRSPIVGTVPTEAECRHIKDWNQSPTEVWYFGYKWVDAVYTTQAQADAYNALHFLRFDSGMVVERNWNGAAFVSRTLTNEWFQLGEKCYIHVNTTATDIDYVSWNGVIL